MYLNQLIEFHRVSGRCGGAPERKVTESLARSQGITYEAAARQIDMAVMMRDIERVKCTC